MGSVPESRSGGGGGGPGPKFWHLFIYFFFQKGNGISTSLIGPPAKRHLKGATLEVRWWPDIGSFFQTSKIIPEESYSFVLFNAVGGGPDPPSTHSSGCAHE